MKLPLLITLALLLLVSPVLPARAQTSPYPAPTFLPPTSHPRVYFTAADLPRLRANSLKPQNAKAWEVHLKNIAAGTDGQLPLPKTQGGGNMSSPVLAVIENLAFDYALRGDTANGQKAITALRNYITSVTYPPKDYNNTGQTVFTLGAVYDWCYPLLTADDKAFFIKAALDTAALMEIGWPATNQGNVTGHGPEAQIFRDLLCAAIAMRDEKPEIYDLVAGRFFSRMIEPRKFAYATHMNPQGVHYTRYRGQWELLATLIFDRLGLPEVFGPDQKHFMYWSLYARRGDGQLLRDGDQHLDSRTPGQYYIENYRPLMLAANAFGDPYLKMEALKARPDFTPMPPTGNQAMSSVESLIFNNPDLEPRPLAELPLTRYFPSPKGAMIARTGWEEGIKSPVVVAELKINEVYFSNHMHLDAGAFQIYYRGALATDSGYYQAAINKTDTPLNEGSTGYGSLYDICYNKRSVAHNTIQVFDPAETFEAPRWKNFDIANDGGQRFPNRLIEVKDHSDFMAALDEQTIGKVLGQGFGPDAKTPDYTYLKGDLTRAYSKKITAYERSFVFLNLKTTATPAALIVFDRVISSNPDFKKSWLLHGLEAPTITGNRTVFKDTRPGYTGKLTVDTLLPLPTDTTITPIGGREDEYFVNGTWYKAPARKGTVNEGGGYRIEVSPNTPRTTDYFLNVLQVGDHTPDTTPLTPTPILTETHAGLRLADRVVLFAKSRDRLAAPVTFTVPNTGTSEGPCQILIADLKEGTWTAQRQGDAPIPITVSPAEGTAVFQGPPGTYSLTPAR